MTIKVIKRRLKVKRNGVCKMSFKPFFTKEDAPNNREWKEKNKGYLRQLQKFLDVADNIEREDLRKSVIAEMLKCDMILTQLAERQINLALKNDNAKK